MSRDKQIEEIYELTNVLWEANHKKSVLDYHWLATEAYNAGYRKASDLAEEIFAEIEKHFLSGTTPLGLSLYSIGSGTYIKLKKKYTEGGKEQDG